MWHWKRWMLPVAFHMAEANAGGAAEGEAPIPTGEEHFAEMRTAQEARAGLPAEGGVEAGKDVNADDPATETPESKPKPDPKAAAKPEGEYVPKERFDAALGALKDENRDLRSEIEALKKGSTKPPEPEWKAKLKPLPAREGRIVDGKFTEWESTEAYLDARQDALHHNAQIQRDGEEAEAKAKQDSTASQQKAQADLAAWRQNHITKTIPEFVKAEGITAEQFQEALAKAPSIPILDAATGDSIGMAIQQLSKDAARFSYAVATASAEALTPYAAEIMAAAPGPARTLKIVEVVGRMDALLAHGLGFDGKPRVSGKTLTSAAASANSETTRASRTTTVVASTEGGGGAGGQETATGEAHFNAMRASQQRKQQARLAGLKR